jgi:hypothetical protein
VAVLLRESTLLHGFAGKTYLEITLSIVLAEEGTEDRFYVASIVDASGKLKIY